MKTLKEALEKRNSDKKKALPSATLEYMDQVTKDLKEAGYESKPLNVGDKIPDSQLLNHRGETVSIKELLDGKPAIISFYRGTWCPYCNMELAFYEELLGENSDEKISMFAISSEKPDVTMESVEIEKLHFRVLSDIDNKFARKLNLLFKVPEKLQTIYDGFGIDLKKSQGNDEAELPIAATYIIDGEGIITNAWIDANYTTRAEPSEVIEAYKKLV
jgi:peroxiredoxin